MNFNSLDYWARQKIAEGYLYHIESTLNAYELASYLKSQLKHNVDRVVSHESSEDEALYRFITFVEDKVMQAIHVQSIQGVHPINELSNILTARFSAESESEILAVL